MKVRDLVANHWSAIRQTAGSHGIDRITFWPPIFGEDRGADFLVDGQLGNLRGLRADLERELGCDVSIYLADQAPAEAMPAQPPPDDEPR